MMSGKMMSTTQECYHFLMSGTMICLHDKSEDLLIYGVNSSKQSIYIAIKWRPKGVDNQMNATISLRFDDNNSNSYTLEE
ncbi:unnamed protein product, partial [Oppiella nova]